MPKILIVDDERHIRVLLLQMLEDLEKSGAEMFTASDGDEGWQLAQAEKPDLIILDIMMPGLSGYEVCERIKNDPSLSHTHVLILSAKIQAIDRQRSIDAGADRYISKPFDTMELIRYVTEVLDIAIPYKM